MTTPTPEPSAAETARRLAEQIAPFDVASEGDPSIDVDEMQSRYDHNEAGLEEQRRVTAILLPVLTAHEEQVAKLTRENDRLHDCLAAANFGDVPKGWDDAIARAEKAEEQVARLTRERDELATMISKVESVVGKRGHDVLGAVEDMRQDRDEVRQRLTAAEQKRDEARHSFKNFHYRLCERFGYSHDEVDWDRDLASLEEWIAKRLTAAEDALRVAREDGKRLDWLLATTGSIAELSKHWMRLESPLGKYPYKDPRIGGRAAIDAAIADAQRRGEQA